MSAATLAGTLDFVSRIADETHQTKVKITFHGGEPLMAPHGYWRQALTGLRERFGANGVEIALQSNLRYPQAHWPETIADAARLDELLGELWCQHPHYVKIEGTPDFSQEKTEETERVSSPSFIFSVSSVTSCKMAWI